MGNRKILSVFLVVFSLVLFFSIKKGMCQCSTMWVDIGDDRTGCAGEELHLALDNYFFENESQTELCWYFGDDYSQCLIPGIFEITHIYKEAGEYDLVAEAHDLVTELYESDECKVFIYDCD